jgi:hypothetical protein
LLRKPKLPLDKQMLIYLQAAADGGNGSTEGSTDGGETETSDGSGELRGKLEEDGLAVLLDGDEELLSGAGDVGDEVTDLGGSLDDLTKRGSSGTETKAGNESRDLRAELNKELLGVGAGNGQELANGRGKVREEVVSTLDVLANGSNNRAEGNTDGGETEAGNEASDLRGQRDEESTNVSTEDSDETVDVRAETSDKATKAGGRGNNGTERSTESRETEARDEAGDIGGQLDEESANIGTSDGQDVLELGTQVLDDVAVRANWLVLILLGGGETEGLGEVTDGGDDGKLGELKLVGEVANLEVLDETLNTVQDGGEGAGEAGQTGQTVLGRGGSGAHGQSQGNKGGLHLDRIRILSVIKSD